MVNQNRLITDLTQPIAYGRTAEIYAWNEEQVLKLFYNWFPLENIQYEQRIAEAVCRTDLPVPSVGEILNINNRFGLLYGRVDGITMFELMEQEPWNIFRYAHRMAELHIEMHSDPTNATLPNLKTKLKNKINQAEGLSVKNREKVLTELADLPDGDRLCHGDFHPMNIIMTAHGETIIDWIDSAVGNPLADLARTTIIARGAMASNQIKKAMQKLIVRIFHHAYITYYFSTCPAGKEEYLLWLPIVAAARLSENIPELKSWLIKQASY
jgi:hypothetical protein